MIPHTVRTFADSEPVITAGAIVTLVGSVLALVAAFGLPITEEQQKAILAVVAAFAPLAMVLLVRPHVVPTPDPATPVAPTPPQL